MKKKVKHTHREAFENVLKSIVNQHQFFFPAVFSNLFREKSHCLCGALSWGKKLCIIARLFLKIFSCSMNWEELLTTKRATQTTWALAAKHWHLDAVLLLILYFIDTHFNASRTDSF